MFLFSSAFAEVAEAVETTAEAVATAAPEAAQTSAAVDYVSSVFKKFSGFTLSTWIILGVLVALGLILLAAAKSGKKWTAKTIAYAALSIALSFVLSYVRLFRMPQGGSITPASMLPLMLFSASFGVAPGVVAGLAYGILQYLQGGDFLNVWQFLLDYPIAFAALGLAGLYKHLNKTWQAYAALAVMFAGLLLLCVSYPSLWVLYAVLMAATVALFFVCRKNPDGARLLPAMGVAVLGRAVSAVCAGLIWVAVYPLEDPNEIPLIYSLVYNGAYLLPEAAICMVLAFITGNRIMKTMQ